MKFFNTRFAYTAFAILSLFIFATTSCKKDEKTTNPIPVDPYPIPSNLKLIGETFASGAAAKVKVYAEKDLFAGYNKLYVALFDSLTGVRITGAHVHFEPVMDMGSMTHGCPVENPGENAVNGLFKGAVIFTMASSGSMTWTLGLHVHNHLNDLEGDGEINIDVTAPADARVKVRTALNDGKQLILTIIEPAAPKVGVNDFIMAIHKLNTSTHEYDTISGCTVQIEPLMPSMGHGSPNNVNPVYTGNGHYAGKVNLTMSGLWQLNFKIMEGTAAVDTTASFTFNP